MSRLTLRLPTWMHQKLEEKARANRLSLNQFIVNLLARQLAEEHLTAGPDQQAHHQTLLDTLTRASHEDIRKALDEREPTEPEVGLTAEIVAKIQNRLDRRA